MNHVHRCLICLGSNSDAEAHLAGALASISSRFRMLWLGRPVLTPDACGCPNVNEYLNQALLIECQEDAGTLRRLLKAIERENGRTPESKLTGVMPLDIDLLTFDGRILKPGDMAKRHVIESTSGLADALIIDE